MHRVTYDSAISPFAPDRMLAALWARRELIGTLALRDIRARYRQSILGVYWTILNPLAMALVYTLVFSLIAQVPVGNVPYGAFVFCGLVPWSLFSNGLANATNSLVGMAGLLTKVAFPREVLPLAAILARLVDLLVSLGVLLLIIAWYRLPLSWTVLLLPIPILVELIFLLGLGLLLSAANLFYRDVGQLLGVALSLWIFVTPVVYPLERVPPALRPLILLNPLTPVVSGFQDLLLNGRVPAAGPLLTAGAIALATLVLGYLAFKWAEPLFAETV